MPLGASSTYFILASVVVGAMFLIGFGLLFVRATNIERTNLVAATTLIGAFLGALLLYNASVNTTPVGDGVAWSAILISLFGFALGRIWDLVLGPRAKVHRDNATLGADLSD